MAKKRKVLVLFKDGEFVVDPPTVELEFQGGNGDQLRLVNRTNEDLVWSLEDAAAFGAPILEIVKSNKLSPLKTAANITGVFEYQVLMIKSGKKAKGNSDPVIIIEN
jgi:hypothetical protein